MTEYVYGCCEGELLDESTDREWLHFIKIPKTLIADVCPYEERLILKYGHVFPEELLLSDPVSH
jgi:hypothetical protein